MTRVREAVKLNIGSFEAIFRELTTSHKTENKPTHRKKRFRVAGDIFAHKITNIPISI